MRSVDYLDLIQSFVARCERNEPSEALVPAFHNAMTRLGIRHFACYTHYSDPIEPANDAVLVHNYPPEWVRVYSESALYEIDPVLRYAERYPMPFYWDAPSFRATLTAPQSKLLAAAGRFGLAHGYTIPIHLSWTPGMRSASCSIVPANRALDARAYLGAQMMASYLFIAATRTHAAGNTLTPPVVLTERERQCLVLVAHGKDDWAAGRLLHVSAATVHTLVERAKQRLGVSTRTQAVVQALVGRQLSFGDIVRPQEIDPKKVQDVGHARLAAQKRMRRLESLARPRH